MIVFHDGKWEEEHMNALRLEQQDITAAARQQGIRNVQQIQYAIVERNRAVSVFRTEE